MATYNGGCFLHEQLASIAAQTRAPREIVVSDDGSQDTTLEVVSAFADSARFPINVLKAHGRIGVEQNFARAIESCSGEIIALSDQDDVWYPRRLEILETTFHNNPEVDLILCDADILSQNGVRLARGLRQFVGYSETERQLLNEGRGVPVLLKRNVFTGGAMVFRRRILDYVLPIPASRQSVWLHDRWIGFLVVCAGSVMVIEDRLSAYRQHENQLVGARSQSFLTRALSAYILKSERMRIDCEGFVRAHQRLTKIRGVKRKSLDVISDKIDHLRRRITTTEMGVRRVPIIIREAMNGRYRKYSAGIWSVLRDLTSTSIIRRHYGA